MPENPPVSKFEIQTGVLPPVPFQLLSATIHAPLTSTRSKVAMRLQDFQPFWTGIDYVPNDPRHCQSWCTAPQNATQWVGLGVRRPPLSPPMRVQSKHRLGQTNKSHQNQRVVPPAVGRLLSTLHSQFNATIARGGLPRCKTHFKH